MLRSEYMTLCQIIDHNDATRAIVTELGELGIAQIKDMNPDVAVYKRTFSDEMRRCEDLNRRLNFIGDQLAVGNVTTAARDEVAMRVCKTAARVGLP